MPELPEVETVRRGLAPVMEGAILSHVEARRPDLRFPLPDQFVERLSGARVLQLLRRAKYLIAHLDRGESLIMHLGMSGRFGVVDGDIVKTFDDYVYATGGIAKHDHIVFHVQDGPKIVYNDPRRFGFMDLVATDKLETCPHFAKMGPEPLGNGFHEDGLRQALAHKKTTIKAALLDQSTVAGLGNIYVCEALFRARISPLRIAADLTASQIERLTFHIRGVLNDAIGAGGSSLRDFASTDGSLGGFQERFDVYGREGQPCQCDGRRGVIVRLVQSGRSSFYCPTCQI
ncbi:MAG: bifunctional DNA-formamidopyrimidine glycosylase/DNA-(apurinic or apyrimidinic site) lyase [Hyphomonadaceae bacterium]|nr:bifunctional DNA-formamidopyrimidine glycosylase/DNA-(apurinic or apyrimidinic site) lyase [Hyphomonadaceae bacterium]